MPREKETTCEGKLEMHISDDDCFLDDREEKLVSRIRYKGLQYASTEAADDNEL